MAGSGPARGVSESPGRAPWRRACRTCAQTRSSSRLLRQRGCFQNPAAAAGQDRGVFRVPPSSAQETQAPGLLLPGVWASFPHPASRALSSGVDGPGLQTAPAALLPAPLTGDPRSSQEQPSRPRPCARVTSAALPRRTAGRAAGSAPSWETRPDARLLLCEAGGGAGAECRPAGERCRGPRSVRGCSEDPLELAWRPLSLGLKIWTLDLDLDSRTADAPAPSAFCYLGLGALVRLFPRRAGCGPPHTCTGLPGHQEPLSWADRQAGSLSGTLRAQLRPPSPRQTAEGPSP